MPQYIISTPAIWPSYFGNAFLALMNESGSNKKMVFRSIDVFVQTALNADTALTSCSVCDLFRTTTPPTAGEVVPVHSQFDTEMTVPTTVMVRRMAELPSFGTRLRRVDVCRRSGAVGTQNMYYSQREFSRLIGHLYRSPRGPSTTVVEPLLVRQGEIYALVGETTLNTYPVRINLLISINGKSVNYNFTAVPRPGVAIFTIENQGTDVVRILHIAVSELGTNDTPFIRVVPIGQIYAEDMVDTPKFLCPSISKMDTSSPDLTALRCFGDIAFVPRGVPAVAIAEGSAGSPKSMNYLHTRDFDGPVFRTFLPELCHIRSANVGMPDGWGFTFGFNHSDMLTRRANITINPGEGIALVGSAETAVGVQAAYSGFPNLHFQAIVDVLPFKIPVITITGMVEGSRWRIERTNGEEVSGGVADHTGTASFQFTDENLPVTLILKVRKGSDPPPYYKPVLVSFQLTADGITIPVSQIEDN